MALECIKLEEEKIKWNEVKGIINVWLNFLLAHLQLLVDDSNEI